MIILILMKKINIIIIYTILVFEIYKNKINEIYFNQVIHFKFSNRHAVYLLVFSVATERCGISNYRQRKSISV